MRGKSINLFLMDGDASGRIKCTLVNWTGIAYKIPRTALDRCKERDDLKQSGVYFLMGTSDQTDESVVYIPITRSALQRYAILKIVSVILLLLQSDIRSKTAMTLPRAILQRKKKVSWRNSLITQSSSWAHLVTRYLCR